MALYASIRSFLFKLSNNLLVSHGYKSAASGFGGTVIPCNHRRLLSVCVASPGGFADTFI